MAEAADPLTSISNLPCPPRTGEDWATFVATIGNLRYSEWPSDLERAMAAGSLDIAIGYLPEAPNALIKSTLFREPFVCIARRGHPALQDGVLSLDGFVEMQHVQTLMKDGTMYAAAIVRYSPRQPRTDPEGRALATEFLRYRMWSNAPT